MAIHILPIISTISELAGTTWEIYRKAKQANGARTDKQAHETLARRVAELEDANLEQARLISELSRELDQFAQAVEDEFEARQRLQRRLTRVSFAGLAMGLVALVLIVLVLLR